MCYHVHELPRLRKLWEAVRDGYDVQPQRHHDGDDYVIDPVLARKGITPEGLDSLAVRYMCLMFEKFSEGAGEKRIADALHEPSGVGKTEQLLQDKGFLTFVSRGRKLTQAGRRYVRDHLNEGVL